MARDLTTLDVSAIHDLLELLSPAMAHEIVIDDSEGAQKPKRLSLTNLAKLFVPYNNAVNSLNLGAYDILALRGFFDSLHISVDPASIPSDEDIGAMYWDTNALTYSVVLPNGVRAQIGEELFVLVTRYASAPNPILNGTPVYTVGESGQRPTVDVARADTLSKIKVTGIATHDIANQGRITSFGLVRAIPLARKPSGETWVAGNYLWLAPTGGMTNVEPSSPTPNVRLGLITNVTGSASFDMLVYIRPAMSMYDLYDVDGDAPTNGQEITYDSALGYWKATSRITGAENRLTNAETRISDVEAQADENESDIANLAGAGRTIETVKQNADDIALAGERIDNIIASSGTSDTEVVDARLSGSTGVLYTLLKNRLDAMEKQMVVTNESDVPIATIKFRMSGSQPQLVTEAL